MIVMICIDDRNGMMFNRRRQSRDRVVTDRILECAKGSRLWMNEYSYKLFAEADPGAITVSSDFLGKAQRGDYCFVEDQDILPYEDRIERIILFRWNRSYPADFYFPAEVLQRGFVLTASEEFPGSSHENIIKEEYKNEEN